MVVPRKVVNGFSDIDVDISNFILFGGLYCYLFFVILNFLCGWFLGFRVVVSCLILCILFDLQ